MKSIFFFFLITISIKAQFIEGISTLGLNQFPHTTLKMSGFGNRGFDDFNGTYNPKYNINNSTIEISCSGIINSQINRTTIYLGENYKYLENDLLFFPDANFRLKFGDDNEFQLSLNYFTNVLSSQKFSDKSGTTSLHFSTENRSYEVIVSKESTFRSVEKILLSSLSFSNLDDISISIGLETAYFNQIYDWKTIDPIKFNVDFFTNTQFLFSLNYEINKVSSAYFILKSQSSRIKMDETAFFNGEKIIFPDSYLSNPGNIGYGYQYNLFSRFKISAEMSHQFLEIDEERIYEYYTEKLVHHIWNNELLLGINARIFNTLYTGIMFSDYLKYNNDIYYRFYSDWDVYKEVTPSKLYSIVGSIKYTLLTYDIIFYYQHSQAVIDPEDGFRKVKDYADFFKLTLSAGF